MEVKQNLAEDFHYLQGQLITARNEINNLRQQIKNLRYMHEKDVGNIKKLLSLSTNGLLAEDSVGPQNDSSVCHLFQNPEPSTSSSNIKNTNFKPIGVISSWFPKKRGTPRQPTVGNKIPGKLTLFKSTFTNPEHALQGLEEFSHLWILFYFHKNDSSHVRAKVSPPRLNGLRTGVFSTRSPHRPCPIGLSLVKIIKIENCTIYFEGIDMIDQTPVLDIKPYIPQYDNPLNVGNFLHAVHSVEELTESNILQNSSNNGLWSSNNPSSSLMDISKDEEIALRLQAEEFEDNINLVSTINENEITSLIENNEEMLRRSRHLDGADGPNEIRATELDLMRRCTLNSRISEDSASSMSPIRMGVREAPDGEEDLELQTNQNTATRYSNIDNGNILEETVRVPEWISKSKISSLSVVFNERSLVQLREILSNKADEKKCAIENVLKEDPRSVYLRQRYSNQFYTFLIHNLHITCRFDDERKIVTVFQIKNASIACECGQPEWQCTGHSTSPVYNNQEY